MATRLELSKDAMHEIVKQICAHLGKEYWVQVKDGDSSNSETVKSGNISFYFHYDSWKGQFHIGTADHELRRSGISTYQGNSDPDLNPKISCSAKRDPKALAADIKRRFIPLAEIAFTELRRRKQAMDDHNDTISKNVRAIRAVNPKMFLLPHQADEKQGSLRVWSADNGVSFSAELRVSTNNVDFKLNSLPIEYAVKLAEILNDWHGKTS